MYTSLHAVLFRLSKANLINFPREFSDFKLTFEIVFSNFRCSLHCPDFQFLQKTQMQYIYLSGNMENHRKHEFLFQIYSKCKVFMATPIALYTIILPVTIANLSKESLSLDNGCLVSELFKFKHLSRILVYFSEETFILFIVNVIIKIFLYT